MPSGSSSKRIYLFWLVAFLLVSTPVFAEQLPLRNYTSADGLAQDRVKRIVLDSRGFLWFCTAAGLSRFDGSRFVTYDARDGISYPSVNDLLETRAGSYWIATNGGGVFRFHTERSKTPGQTQSLFTNYAVGDRPQTFRVNRLFEDSHKRIWAGTDDGLFVLNSEEESFQNVPLPHTDRRLLAVAAFAEDKQARIWIATTVGLFVRTTDGRWTRVSFAPNSVDTVFDLLLDRNGRLWVAHSKGLAIFRPGTDSFTSPRLMQRSRHQVSGREIVLPEAPDEFYHYAKADGLATDLVNRIFESSDGRIWITGDTGLAIFEDFHFNSYTNDPRLQRLIFSSLAEDREQNLWFGTASGGALKLVQNGLVTYVHEDGLESSLIIRVFERSNCGVCALVRGPSIACFSDGRFNRVRVRLPNAPSRMDDVLHDHLGQWWLVAENKLYSFPAGGIEQLERASPTVYGPEQGFNAQTLIRLFEDSRGDIWIGGVGGKGLMRWERSSQKFHIYGSSDGVPEDATFHRFAEDRDGGILIGSRDHGLWRYAGGKFVQLHPSITKQRIHDLFVDQLGHVWVSVSSQGLALIDNPANMDSSFQIFNTANGLTSDIVTTVLADRDRRIYAGTARSVDLLDPGTGRVRQYTVADGLAANELTTSLLDSCGNLWFGTMDGLSRLVPETVTHTTHLPPPILIGNLTVAGVAQPISELGEKTLSGLIFDYTKNQLRIDFFGLAFAAGDVLRYQFKLEGADRDWSLPLDQRSVNYANLRPGNYVFLVRAVNADGLTSLEPASISFTIVPPFWQRWWFVTLLVLGLTATVHLIYRYHTSRLLELERVRTRIATDLHDDIGASLSKIAILSEVAGQEVASNQSPSTEPLLMIADTSRDMVDAMSDIVWAVNPKRDHLSDLTQRMRRFAGDLLEARDIEFTFRVRTQEKDVALGVDVRREVYLIFKECVNNLVKHSQCTRAELGFSMDGQFLVISVNDNGKGFNVDAAKDARSGSLGGHGLMSMQRRAEALGGSLSVESEPGKGTHVTLKVPVKHRSWWRNWRYLNGR